ncbi:MAG TPA: hypothetical protein PKD85_11210 [Saprospiraceae bacterium]|nr:hypothetical protein [Saprospiraceae bacterium]
MSIEDKCRAIYKGDVLAGSFYLFFGVCFIIIGTLLQIYIITLGYLYLGLGLLIFGILGFGKGLIMMYLYNARLKYFKNIKEMSISLLSEEMEYTKFRLEKKSRNRRVYIYLTVIATILSFVGAFSDSKSLIMGTMIPIALFSGIEFSISLLTEFRLWEYTRHLNKEIPL